MDAFETQEPTRPITPSLIASVIAGVAAWYVPKDFMKPGPLRGVVRGGGLAAGFGLYMLDTGKDLMELRKDLTEVIEDVAEEIEDTAEDASAALSGVGESAGKSASQSTAGENTAVQAATGQAATGQGTGNKLVFAALVAVMVVAMVASFGLGLLLEKKAIAAMARRGVTYPNTIWGAVSAAAAVGALFLDDNYDAKLSGGVLAK